MVVVTVMLALAAVLSLIRVVRGPSILDRMIAVDAMIVIFLAALATEAALHRNPTTLPMMVVLSILGFSASTGVARFVSVRDEPRDGATGARQ